MRRCERTGSKTQKNNVACHGAESTPKIHSLALLSRVQGCLNIAIHDCRERLYVCVGCISDRRNRPSNLSIDSGNRQTCKLIIKAV